MSKNDIPSRQRKQPKSEVRNRIAWMSYGDIYVVNYL